MVNPIAGLGGYLSLKGSDGIDWKELGLYIGPSYKRSILFAQALRLALKDSVEKLSLLLPQGIMGEDAGKIITSNYKVVCRPAIPTTRDDTLNCAEALKNSGSDLIVFVGGDGTAMDVFSAVRTSVPILGVPAGTKMYSSIFARSIHAAALLIHAFLNDNYVEAEGEILLVDESKLRVSGDYSIQKRELALTIESTTATMHQSSKDFSSLSTEDIEGIAEYVTNELISNDTPLIIGPGKTCSIIAKKLNINKKSILSVAAGYKNSTYCDDCDSNQIASFTEHIDLKKLRIILSPIGNAGFLIGRGNQQITVHLLSKITKENIIIVGSYEKFRKLRSLLIDITDKQVAERLSGYARAIIGYNEELTIKIEVA